MQLTTGPGARRLPSGAVALFIGALLAVPGSAKTCIPRGDPFRIVDPQNWVNPDDMTWADFKAPPGSTWNDPSRKGSSRNFNIALVTVDYDDRPFVITGAPNSSIFGNPVAGSGNIARKDVPAFYRDLLNKPNDLNRGHTLHEYWMEDSAGRFGVDLTVFGAYRMPSLAYQYGIDQYFNPGSCPPGEPCELNIRTDALNMWRKEVGDDVADSYELVFFLSAGQDESSTWQEFGEMKFLTKEDVPDEFGPPRDAGSNDTLPNYATTRYVDWTSWAAASNLWPNAGGGSSTQCESSGMGTYAHELSHLLNIPDNYNNPYGNPLRRSYTGPWSMLSRGSFNGPGGPHSRYHIPSLQGGSLGSLHSMRDKIQLNLVEDSRIVRVSTATLAKSGALIARFTARSVESELMGLRVEMDADRSPKCDTSKDVFCDGGNYDFYDVEVVDRMGSDSFQPDSGAMISKSKLAPNPPFQWTIDANPEDIDLIDFRRPDGTPSMVTLGDYRQLADALFHAGTRSGSAYEYVDEPNGLHIYILNAHRDKAGVLSYTVGARSLNETSSTEYGVHLATGNPLGGKKNTPTGNGVFCSFDLLNNGTYASGGGDEDVAKYMGSDIYRISARVEGSGWRVEVPNALVAAKFGEVVSANVAVGAAANAADQGIVMLTVHSESDPSKKATAECRVPKN